MGPPWILNPVNFPFRQGTANFTSIRLVAVVAKLSAAQKAEYLRHGNAAEERQACCQRAVRLGQKKNETIPGNRQLTDAAVFPSLWRNLPRSGIAWAI
jgi:hypothetical protein